MLSPARVLLGTLMLSIAVAAPVRAADLELTAEPGMALFVTAPQSNRFGVGGGLVVKGGLAVTRILDVQLTGAFLAIPMVPSGTPGLIYGAGGGLRLHRSHGAGGFFPWIDADALYIRTGALNRFGFAVAVGMSFPVGAARAFWIGPFLRYLQVVQPERVDFDNRDAKTVLAGLSGQFGAANRLARRPPPPPPPPRYPLCTVGATQLELGQKIGFARDLAQILPGSLPLLDEVAQVLKDRPSLRVRIEGHTDDRGAVEHDQELATERAEAVRSYLIGRGVSHQRLEAKGYGATMPIDTNQTPAGRENNQRVELVIISDGGTK